MQQPQPLESDRQNREDRICGQRGNGQAAGQQRQVVRVRERHFEIRALGRGSMRRRLIQCRIARLAGLELWRGVVAAGGVVAAAVSWQRGVVAACGVAAAGGVAAELVD